MAHDDRVRTALLAGLAAAALATGASWWQGSAPALGPIEPSPSPSRDAFLQPGVRLVDPATGQVLAGSDPEEPVVVHVRPTDPLVTGGGAVELWHERSQLVPGSPPLARQSSTSDVGQYMLTVRCSGPGAVIIEFSGARYDLPPSNVRCGDGSQSSVVESAGGPLLVRFSAVEGEVDLDARLVQLS
ncbi:hypothetical protein ONA70_16225 [Micromonospora yasonensis]|uniref:hypothetical protein n=1 Tax=Micromonospora yasonensis TaxID=1128667 RepID=UPI00223238F8|nr:hypothetical protein [Micromonospora yasonensis]MCW3841648.1 hypothetical protein [Micromonospora yasonensis]